MDYKRKLQHLQPTYPDKTGSSRDSYHDEVNQVNIITSIDMSSTEGIEEPMRSAPPTASYFIPSKVVNRPDHPTTKDGGAVHPNPI